MANKSKYETHVLPYLDKISEWYEFLSEGQIAKSLGVAARTFVGYKKDHPELVECLKKGREELVIELKETLKRKAKGYTYTETKRTIREIDGKRVTLVEEFERHAQPDVGAIHLLLKNLDDTWRNDDAETMKLKKEQVKIAKEKAENAAW